MIIIMKKIRFRLVLAYHRFYDKIGKAPAETKW